VFTAGVFDLFHVGHLEILRRCKELGDFLVVGVLTDEAASAYKPKPVIPYKQRKEIICQIKYVDAVFRQLDTNATELLKQINPDILVHGDDHTPGWEIGQTWMKERGKEFVLLPRTTGVSSTDIKKLCSDLNKTI
jgi:glycerol-3-phosphate cytidylyltransferase